MSALSTLPVEILEEILLYLVESPHNIRAIAQINRRLNDITRPFLHHHKVINFTAEDLIAVPNSWLTDNDVLRGTHHLTISRRLPPPQMVNIGRTFKYILFYSTLDFRPLVEFITKLSRLESIEWDCKMPIPLEILDAIHTHPMARLMVTDYTRHFDHLHREDPVEIALSRSPALVSIRATIFATNHGSMQTPSAPDVSLAEASFRRIVACAPNLRSASLTIIPQSGTRPPPEVWHEIEKKRHIYQSHGCQSSSLRSLKVRDGRRGGWMLEPILEDWARDVKLEMLEHFNGHDRPPSFASDVPPYFNTPRRRISEILPSLKEMWMDVNASNPDYDLTLREYFLDIGPLEVLRLDHWGHQRSILTNILERHGESLKVLQLHNSCSFPWRHREPAWKFITFQDLSLIKNHCPGLHELSVEALCSPMSLEISNQRELISSLAAIRARRVHLRFEVRMDTEQKGVPCYLRSTHLKLFVADLWGILFKGAMTTEDRELTIVFTDVWAHSSHCHPNSSRWVAQPNERDDMSGHCVVEGACSWAEWEEARQLEVKKLTNRVKNFPRNTRKTVAALIFRSGIGRMLLPEPLWRTTERSGSPFYIPGSEYT